MNAKENLYGAILAAFKLNLNGDESPEVAASACTEILTALADAIRGSAPELVAGAELIANDSSVELAVELRELTEEVKKLRYELAKAEMSLARSFEEPAHLPSLVGP